MHSSSAICLFINALAVQRAIANPVQLVTRDLQVTNIQSGTGAPPQYSPDDKRSLTSEGGLVVDDTTTGTTLNEDGTSLKARGYGYTTTHCGLNHGKFMPLVAVNPTEHGVNDAIASWCNHFDGTVVPEKSYISALIQSTGGETLRLTDRTIGHFMGVIYAKKKITVSAATCIEYMQAIGNKGSKCYGSKNKDMNGGRNEVAAGDYDAVPLAGAT
ncbi:MAG: hypothetical protein M1836_003736 [Candelina mexicana]|nr:MAG: hypothetical protein M1836_003736 [Candelina mexicana]